MGFAPKRGHKYRAVRTTVDGITFASKKEAKRYGELKQLLYAGKICDLELQPRFELHEKNGKKVCEYVADFSYIEGADRIIEDVKGFRVPLYRLKRKWVELEYGIKITEV